MLRALLFDLNGLIVDDEPIHFRLLRDVLAEEGIRMNWEEYAHRYLAYDDKDCFRVAFEQARKPITPEKVQQLIARKAALYEQEKHTVGLFPGVKEFIFQARQSGCHLAVASGALREEIHFLLQNAGLDSCFEAVVGAQDVSRGKPDPEIFLKALGRLNSRLSDHEEPISPGECLVLEDSVHGVLAATRAGLRCLAITNSYPQEKLQMAQWVKPTLKGVTFDEVKKLFESNP